VVAYLEDGNAWAAERLVREPGWVLDAALANAGDTGGVFAAHLQTASGHEIAALRLGKKSEALYAECERLHRQLDRYAYDPPPIRFAEEDVDCARAAGVLIEFDSSRPIIVDRSLYRELVKAAIKRTHAELESKAAAAAEHRKTQRTAGPAADPVAVAKRERDAQLRELADQAHGANADLGTALVQHLAAVDPADLTVARFFVLCRRRHRANYADRLTMRISRCRTRGNGDEAGLDVAPPKHATVALVAGEEDGFRRASMDRFHVGARLLTPADLRRRRSLRRWPRWRAQRLWHARDRRRSSSHPAAARRLWRSSAASSSWPRLGAPAPPPIAGARDDASSASRVKSRLGAQGDPCPCLYPRGFNVRRRRPVRVGSRSFGRRRGEPMASRSFVPVPSSARQDAVAATALTVVRRALIEGVPVTREVVEREASVNLGASPRDAMRQLDLVAQRLGVSSLG
jgi:hypothetical protein